MNLLKERITCEKFLHLVKKSLRAGYKDPLTNKIVKPEIGTPQGSVLSPLLVNIVLHELDKYITLDLIPSNHKGIRRRNNPSYDKIAVLRDPRKPYFHKISSQERELALSKLRSIPRGDPRDPNFRRCMYVRYADDFVILFEGPKSEALLIKKQVKSFLLEATGLELNDEKTLITNLQEGFDFLGASIKGVKNLLDKAPRMLTTSRTGKVITMRANLRARVNMPTLKLLDQLIKSGFASYDKHRNIVAKPLLAMVNHDQYTILKFYNYKIHGLLNYYSFAGNRIEIQNII